MSTRCPAVPPVVFGQYRPPCNTQRKMEVLTIRIETWRGTFLCSEPRSAKVALIQDGNNEGINSAFELHPVEPFDGSNQYYIKTSRAWLAAREDCTLGHLTRLVRAMSSSASWSTTSRPNSTLCRCERVMTPTLPQSVACFCRWSTTALPREENTRDLFCTSWGPRCLRNDMRPTPTS